MVIKNRVLLCLAIIPFMVLFSTKGYSQQFDNPVNISQKSGDIETEPYIAVDQDNRVHIVWSRFYAKQGAPDGVASDICYSNNVAGSFSTPVTIVVPAGWYSRRAAICVDSDGYAHIVFRRSEDQMNVLVDDDLYYVTNRNGNFSNPTLLIDGKSTYPLAATDVKGPRYPLIHCDSQDNLHLTVQCLGIGDIYGDLIIYLNATAGNWNSPMLAGGRGIITYGDYDSYLDIYDKMHIVFANWDSVLYFHNMDGEFSSPVCTSNPEHSNPTLPQMAIDSNQKAHVVYRAPFVMPGNPDLFYVNNVSDNFESWEPICPYNTYNLPSIAVDPLDIIHIAYKEFMAYGGALYYGNNSAGSWSFSKCDKMTRNWYPGSCYFVVDDNSNMHFSFYDLYQSDYEIFYLKGSWKSTCLLGDVNMDEAITPGDALCAFQMYLNGGVPVSGSDCDNECALEVADVNCTKNGITPGDALYIFMAYLNQQDPPLDCNPDNLMKKSDNTIVSMDDVTGAPGHEISIPVAVSHVTAMQAFGLDLSFPQNLLEFSRIETGIITHNWNMLDANLNVAGVVTIGGFSKKTVNIEESAELVNVVFKVKDGAIGEGYIDLFNLTDDLENAETRGAQFHSSIFFATEHPEEYVLEQNYPNPFNIETEIKFKLPQSDRVTIRIYNSVGHLIREYNPGFMSAGQHSIMWDGRDAEGTEVSSGLYMYVMMGSQFTAYSKMILLK